MNRLYLEERHKSKLLEMCLAFFPEYKNITVSNYQIDADPYRGVDMVSFYSNDTVPYEIESIPWTELYLTQLTTKINDLYDEKYITSAEKKAFAENNYPAGLPKNWKEIWANRPYLQVWHNWNLGYPKKHPIDYLYKQFKSLFVL